MLSTTTIRKSIGGLLLMAVLASGTASCKKDKDNSPEPTPTPNPAAQKLKEFKTGEEFIRFDYNAAGNVSKVIINSDDVNTGGNEMIYTVTYDGGKIASLESNGEKIVPVYENNLLKRADVFEANQRIGYTNYHFEGGLLKTATLYFGEDGDYQPALEFIFKHNTAGNITEMVTMVTGEEPGQMIRAGHINYQYDQKTNPLYVHRDLLAIFWQSASKNNIKVEEHFDSDLQLEDKFVYEYQYNNNGLPKTGVVTQGLPGEPPVINNISFIYQ